MKIRSKMKNQMINPFKILQTYLEIKNHANFMLSLSWVEIFHLLFIAFYDYIIFLRLKYPTYPEKNSEISRVIASNSMKIEKLSKFYITKAKRNQNQTTEGQSSW